MTNSSGDIEMACTFDPFGRVVETTQNAVPELGFQGMFYHRRSNSNLTLYRDYQPELGLWISRDPFNSDPNGFLFELNSPTNNTDPFGLDVTATYCQRSHTLTIKDNQTTESITTSNVFSGNGECTNNPDAQAKESEGPIPTGDYLIGQGYLSGHNPGGNDTWYKLYGPKNAGGQPGYHYENLYKDGQCVKRGYLNLHVGQMSDGCVTVWSTVPPGANYPDSDIFRTIERILNSTAPLQYKGSQYVGTLKVSP
jgi:RHS repeat-associated protein